MGVWAALTLLVLTYGEMYAEQYHGQLHHDTKEFVKEHKLDIIIPAITEKKLELKWKF